MLSEREQFQLIKLKSFGILREIVNIPAERVCAVMCADGNRFKNRYEHIEKLQIRSYGKSWIHPLTRHGGPLCLIPSTTIKKASDQDLIEEILEAWARHQVKLLLLVVDYPCLAAERAGIGLVDTLNLAIAAYHRMNRETNERLCTLPLFDIHYDGSGKQRTYLIDIKNWRSLMPRIS